MHTHIKFIQYDNQLYEISQLVLQCKQHNRTVLRDSILRLHLVDYFLKYDVLKISILDQQNLLSKHGHQFLM